MSPATRGRILIVEDNFLINETIVEACRDWGYEAYGVFDAVSAAELLDAGAFDLLVVDYSLPGGISGDEVLRHYRSSNPGGAAVVISGMGLPSELPTNPIRFLQKPFTVHQLGAIISSLDAAQHVREVA